MTQLTNQQIGATYGDVITTTNSGQGLPVTNPVPIQDGLGNNSPITMSQNIVNFTRTGGYQFQLDGVALTASANNINVVAGGGSQTGAFQLPVGTTAERPVSPTVGEIRFNTDSVGSDLIAFEGWTGGIAWRQFVYGTPAAGVGAQIPGNIAQTGLAYGTTFPGVQWVQTQDAIQTTDNSPHILFSLAANAFTSGVCVMIASISAKAVGTQDAAYCLESTIGISSDNTSSITVIGSTPSITMVTTAGLNGITAAWSNQVATIQLRVTGLGATAINWLTTVRYYFLTQTM